MRSLARTSIYVVALLSLCVYGTYRVHIHPGQVQARLEAQLGRFVTRDVVAEACELELFGPIRAREIVFPAAPLIDERAFLTLTGVEIEGTPGQRPFRFRKVSSAVAAPPTYHASHGVLRLDHEVLGPAKQEVERWSFRDLLRTQAILDGLEASAGQVLLDRFEVQFQDLRPPRAKLALTLAAREVEARWSKAAEVTLGAELDECEIWSGGYLELKWSPTQGIHARGQVDELKRLELLSPFLGWGGEAWEALRPSGVLGVDLESLHWTRGGKLELQAVIEHYDTSLSLEPSGLEIRRLRGSMLVTETGWRIGADARGVGHAEVLGSAVEVAGSWSDGKCRLELMLAPGTLESVLPAVVSARRGAWGAVAELLQPRGSIDGRLEVVRDRDGQQEVAGVIGFRELRWAGIPILESARGKLTFPFPLSRERASGGRGKIDIDEARCAGLGEASGAIQLGWNDDGVRVEFLDLKLGGDGAGSIFASLAWSRGAIEALDARALDLQIKTALLEASGVGGSIRRLAAEGAAPGRIAEGTFEIGAGQTRTGALWAASPAIAWRGGKGTLAVDAGTRRRIVLSSLRLGGESQALRARGDLALNGALDLVILVAEGAGRDALERLPDDSPPSRWKEAAQGHFRAFRVSGTVNHPRLREIGALDPAFVEASPVEEPRKPAGG